MMFAAIAAVCAVQVFRPAGTPRSASISGPGLVLSGSGFGSAPQKKILAWIDAHIRRSGAARAGNLLVLKASGGRDYSDDFYRESRLASIQEILIPPCASRRQVDSVATYADRAQVVLFAGGDQAHYVPWKGSSLIQAIKRVYARGGIVGGGSAGLAIQGPIAFDSVAADKWLPDDEDVATRDAVRNPFERAISFTMHMFDWPPLRDSITDSHFARRDRFGRLAAFMARTGVKYGIGIDQSAALLVDGAGLAKLVLSPRQSDGYMSRGAYILFDGKARRLLPGKPLLYSMNVIHLRNNGDWFDFKNGESDSGAFTVTVSGAHIPPYSRSPY